MRRMGLGKRIATAAAVLLACGLLFFTAVKRKWIVLNHLAVRPGDTIGVDISRYQGEVDMPALMEQKISFVYMKATEGGAHVDERFRENWRNAGRAGLPSGAYHFFSFESGGAGQARHFMETVGNPAGRLIPAVDLEYYGPFVSRPPRGEDVVRELRAFLMAVEEAWGVRPMIYTNPVFHERYLEGEFDGYPKWIRSVYLPLSWRFGGNWCLWQYTDRGKLKGYRGIEPFIDMNVMNRGRSLEHLTVPGAGSPKPGADGKKDGSPKSGNVGAVDGRP